MDHDQPANVSAIALPIGEGVTPHREMMIMPTGRYHCEACGWDGKDPMLNELQGEGCGGVLWTLRVCLTCGEDVSQTVILDQEDREEPPPLC